MTTQFVEAVIESLPEYSAELIAANYPIRRNKILSGPYTPRYLVVAHIRALTAETEDDGWQPIETAPIDGREVLLKVELRAGIRGRMLVGHYMAGGHCIEDHPPIEAGWYFWNGLMFDREAKPTHWMPLPK